MLSYDNKESVENAIRLFTKRFRQNLEENKRCNTPHLDSMGYAPKVHSRITTQEMSAIRCPLFFETVRFLCKDCKKHFQYVRHAVTKPLDITNISIFSLWCSFQNNFLNSTRGVLLYMIQKVKVKTPSQSTPIGNCAIRPTHNQIPLWWHTTLCLHPYR